MAGRVLFIAIGPSFSLLRIKKKGGSVSLKAHPYGRAKFIIKLTPPSFILLESCCARPYGTTQKI